MSVSQVHYLPLAPPFFFILVGLFLLLLVLIQLGVLRYAYMRLGISSGAALLLLFASRTCPSIGCWRSRRLISSECVMSFPVVAQWPGTVIAVNVGGAVIPTAMSLYLLTRHRLWAEAALATTVVAAVCYWLSRPIPGLGIAEPVFVPSIITAIVALLLSRERAAPLAYIGGSLGTVIGADLLNLGNIRGLGAPVASIGGAGTFDGIFLIGIVAVLIASLSKSWSRS
jgi:uncharacterized membrane protein